jgi:hypothetical protein
MRLVQILLPIYSNTGVAFDQKLFTNLRDELVEQFGGITAYTRTRAWTLAGASKSFAMT